MSKHLHSSRYLQIGQVNVTDLNEDWAEKCTECICVVYNNNLCMPNTSVVELLI